MTLVPAPDHGGHLAQSRPEMPTELVVALHAYRRAPLLDEQELALTWTLATLERRDEDFEVVALAVMAWGYLLRRRAEQPLARGGLLDRIGADSATLIGYALREGSTDTFADIADFMGERGVVLPPLLPGQLPPPIWQLVVQVVEEYRALWLDARLRLGGDVDAIECVALAAHALCAPDAVWPVLDMATDPEGTEGAKVRHPGFLEPNELIATIVRVHLEHAERIDAARTVLADLRAADKLIRSDLQQARLGIEARRRLDAAHVDTAYLLELVDHQQRYQQGGMWTRLAHGSVDEELRQECQQVLASWSAVIADAGQVEHAAQLGRERELGRYVEAAERFARDDPGPPYANLRRHGATAGPSAPPSCASAASSPPRRPAGGTSSHCPTAATSASPRSTSCSAARRSCRTPRT